MTYTLTVGTTDFTLSRCQARRVMARNEWRQEFRVRGWRSYICDATSARLTIAP